MINENSRCLTTFLDLTNCESNKRDARTSKVEHVEVEGFQEIDSWGLGPSVYFNFYLNWRVLEHRGTPSAAYSVAPRD